MTALLVTLSIILIAIIVVQIGRVTELASKIRGEEEMQRIANNRHSAGLLIFMVLFLAAVIVTGLMYKNYYLGFGPQMPASEHGGAIDNMFKVTLFFTGIVFFITQILLFYFAWRYKAQKGRKAAFISHDNRLELIWTAIPAVVMAFLVISGLDAWNEVMADIPFDSDEEYIEIEAMGYQFAWAIRYPGDDEQLGARDYTLIDGTNPFGQDWTDESNLDDFHPQEIVLPVGKKVRVRITARDVLHNFYLPHFRVKMDAVPGMPTYFVFTPSKTTEEYRQELSQYPEFQQPYDPADPEGPQMWEEFNYELACAELCGRGHYSMRRIVRIVSEEEYEAWLGQQTPYYESTIRGTGSDPFTDQWFEDEIRENREAFNTKLDELVTDPEADIFVFDHVNFESGSAELSPLSRYELDFLVESMSRYPDMRIEIDGYTDSQGSAEMNQELSERRAQSVYDYLVNKGIDSGRLTTVGYGESNPVGSNESAEGMAENRRSQFRIVSL